MYIGSVNAAGMDPDNWIPILKDMESIGVDAIELDTGGPHATFGAVKSQLDCGAPQAMDPEKSGAIVKMCAEAVDIPVIFKATPQCVNQAAVSHAVVEAGAAAITATTPSTHLDRPRGRRVLRRPLRRGLLARRIFQPFSLAKVLETHSVHQGLPGHRRGRHRHVGRLRALHDGWRPHRRFVLACLQPPASASWASASRA